MTRAVSTTSPEPYSREAAMSPPLVLVTGATGFIGGAAVTQILLSEPACRLLLLVRGDSQDIAEVRLRRSLSRFADLALLEPALSRCEVIGGDLTDRTSLADPRLDKVTHVLHLAANTSFRSVRSVRHTNILGTLTLAHRMRRVPGLQRFLYVGTAFICGAEAGRIVHEDDYPRPNVRHLVEYTSSKAECEMLLENTAPELPLVIARPSVVVGHTRLGCAPSASIFWFYRTLALLRRINFSPDTLQDVVPVDYTAETLAYLLFRPHLSHRRYHISSGTIASAPWHEIAAAFDRIQGERRDDPYQRVDFTTLLKERARLASLLGPGDEDHLLSALEIYFRFTELKIEVFDNERLLAEGMPPPPRFPSYLPQCATLPPNRSVYQQMKDDE